MSDTSPDVDAAEHPAGRAPGDGFEFVQLLDEHGDLHEHPSYAVDLNDDALLDLYRLMVVSRAVDGEAINLQRQGELAIHCPSRGQEAAQVGAACALGERDWVFPQGRELALAIARGLPPHELLQVWRGTTYTGHDPYEYCFAPFTMPIATQALHAVGFAMGARLDGSDVVTLACLGDGAMSEGDAHEALNFAAVFRAPCVFLVQNNQWAISVPASAQSRASTIADKGVGYGMPAVRCDGNDVLATLVVVREAVERARKGGGPTLVEAVTYRMEGHSTSDDPKRYRPDGELELWQGRDPLTRMATFLRGRGILDRASADAVAAEADDARAILRKGITEAPPPDPTQIFDHVYTDMPASVGKQREQLVRLVARREKSG